MKTPRNIKWKNDKLSLKEKVMYFVIRTLTLDWLWDITPNPYSQQSVGLVSIAAGCLPQLPRSVSGVASDFLCRHLQNGSAAPLTVLYYS